VIPNSTTCILMSKSQNLALRASTKPSTQVKKSASPIRTNRLRKILLRATTPLNTVHLPVTVHAVPVIAAATEAAIAAAVTAVATGHNLADAAAEDVLGVAAVAADAVVVAVAADTARVARAICLRPSMLPRRVANLAVGIAARSVVLVVEDIRSAAGTIIVALGVTSITAATLRALPRHPLLRTRRKSRSFCRVNHSPNIVGVPCRNRLRQLLLWNRNASNRRPTRMNRSHGLLVSPLLPMLRAVRVAVCPAGCWLALPRKELNQPSRTNR
jgi:hypothetical protein